MGCNIASRRKGFCTMSIPLLHHPRPRNLGIWTLLPSVSQDVAGVSRRAPLQRRRESCALADRPPTHNGVTSILTFVVYLVKDKVQSLNKLSDRSRSCAQVLAGWECGRSRGCRIARGRNYGPYRCPCCPAPYELRFPHVGMERRSAGIVSRSLWQESRYEDGCLRVWMAKPSQSCRWLSFWR